MLLGWNENNCIVLIKLRQCKINFSCFIWFFFLNINSNRTTWTQNSLKFNEDCFFLRSKLWLSIQTIEVDIYLLGFVPWMGWKQPSRRSWTSTRALLKTKKKTDVHFICNFSYLNPEIQRTSAATGYKYITHILGFCNLVFWLVNLKDGDYNSPKHLLHHCTPQI